MVVSGAQRLQCLLEVGGAGAVEDAGADHHGEPAGAGQAGGRRAGGGSDRLRHAVVAFLSGGRAGRRRCGVAGLRAGLLRPLRGRRAVRRAESAQQRCEHVCLVAGCCLEPVVGHARQIRLAGVDGDEARAAPQRAPRLHADDREGEARVESGRDDDVGAGDGLDGDRQREEARPQSRPAGQVLSRGRVNVVRPQPHARQPLGRV
jgi:hypothetical protein